MARIRSLKPEFWDDRKLARSTSRDARMLYMGLWNQADEHSRLNGDVAWIKGRVFPFEDDLGTDQITALLGELVGAGRVVQYEVDGDPFIHIPKLSKHQRLEPAKVESRLPAPPSVLDANSSAPRADETVRDGNSSALLYVAGSMEQGEGAPGAPQLSTEFCDNHQPAGTDEPCGKCRRRRLAIEAERARAPTADAEAKAAAVTARRACTRCDENGLLLDTDGRPIGRCDHRRLEESA